VPYSVPYEATFRKYLAEPIYAQFGSLPRGNLRGKTLFISGASRGIGLAIAVRAARDGANIAIAAKTVKDNPRLPGTIYTAAEQVRAAGGRALAIPCDIRNEEQVASALAQTAQEFGGIDIVINNASAISLTPTPQTSMKKFDLMNQINYRGTFLCSKLALPYLKKSANPHILTMSPPLNFEKRWFAPHVAYSIAKFNMYARHSVQQAAASCAHLYVSLCCAGVCARSA
jgi:citronellol/citronellal dehydrogenase